MDYDKLLIQLVKRQQNSKRRKKLLGLIRQILSGKIDSEQVSLDKLFDLHTSRRDQYLSGPRREYISPADRNSYNYGYAEVGQLEV